MSGVPIKHMFEVSLVFPAPMGYNSYRCSIEQVFVHTRARRPP